MIGKVEKLLLRKKPVRLLLNVRMGNGKYVSVLAKEADCTYSHTVKLLDIFEESGLVEFQKQGRIKYVKLTKDGNDLATNLETVLRKLTSIEKGTKVK